MWKTIRIIYVIYVHVRHVSVNVIRKYSTEIENRKPRYQHLNFSSLGKSVFGIYFKVGRDVAVVVSRYQEPKPLTARGFVR